MLMVLCLENSSPGQPRRHFEGCVPSLFSFATRVTAAMESIPYFPKWLWPCTRDYLAGLTGSALQSHAVLDDAFSSRMEPPASGRSDGCVSLQAAVDFIVQHVLQHPIAQHYLPPPSHVKTWCKAIIKICEREVPVLMFSCVDFIPRLIWTICWSSALRCSACGALQELETPDVVYELCAQAMASGSSSNAAQCYRSYFLPIFDANQSLAPAIHRAFEGQTETLEMHLLKRKKTAAEARTEFVILRESNLLISQGTTGFVTWDAARALCEWVLTTPGQDVFNNANKVVELGCGGQALVGLAIHRATSVQEVIVTDSHEDVLSLARKNVHSNTIDADAVTSSASAGGCNRTISVAALDWTRYQPSTDVPSSTQDDATTIQPSLPSPCVLDGAEIIVAADVVFDPALVPGLCAVIADALSHGAVAVVASTERNPATLRLFVSTMCTVYGAEMTVLPTPPVQWLPRQQGAIVYLHRFTLAAQPRETHGPPTPMQTPAADDKHDVKQQYAT